MVRAAALEPDYGIGAYAGSLYIIVGAPNLSWEAAGERAQELGGTLAKIETTEENSFIYGYARATYTESHYGGLYIGLSDHAEEGVWRWADGSLLDYQNWIPGNPSDSNDGEDYGEIFINDTHDPSDNSKWNDSNGTYAGIAEIPFIQRGDSAYVIVQGPTWEEAEANAQALGGHLVTINDAAENSWILENLNFAEQAWIGLDFDISTNQWSWASGDTSEFRNWNEGEPNANSAEWEEFYGVIRKEWGGRWNDAGNHHADEVIYGIAEIKLSDLGITTTTNSDTTPPTLQSTTATSNQLILTFSEDIQIAGGGSLNPAYMTVTVDGQTRKITRSQITAPDHPSIHTASQLVLTLSGRSLYRASSFSVSYNPPTNGSNQGFITDLGNNPLAPITSQAVDTYSSSTNISKSGTASAYTNLILTGFAPISGYGNTQNNTITGNDANNTLDGLVGADTLIGGLGDDTYVVDNVGDVVTELAAEGTDTIQVQPTFNGRYDLADNLENLMLLGSAPTNGTGNSTNNILIGNSGDNGLDGNGGTDTLIGGRGNDYYIVDSTDDVITESGTSRDVDGVESWVSWSLGTNLENLYLRGTSAINGTGNERNNIISGNDAANVIDGGNDGRDSLTGFAGADTFRFSTRPFSFRNTTADLITDFSSAQGDKIQISKSAFGITASTATLSVVSSAAALNTALSGSALFVYNTANGELHWNQNGITRGAGAGGVLAILDNRATLSAGDLVLV